MKEDHTTVCLLIDRRSTLALFLLFVITNSTEINYVIGGAVGTMLSYYYLSMSAARLEEQLQDIQRASMTLQMEVATAHQEFLQHMIVSNDDATSSTSLTYEYF